MPAISVIVPVYKTEKYINRCVDSILAQTFRDFEVILVDDGSPDSCGSICDDYAKKDSRVRVIHQENQGQAAARNHAVSVAKGEWISFVDSDDLIHPQMLEHLWDTAQKTRANITACNALEASELTDGFFDDRNPFFAEQRTDEQGLHTIYSEWGYCYWVVWGKLIHRDILLKYPMAQGRVYEDNAIVFCWLHEAERVAYTDASYYFYQVNCCGTTKGQFSAKKLDFLWALEEQITWYRKQNYKQMLECVYFRYLIASRDLFWMTSTGSATQFYSLMVRRMLRKMYMHNWRNSLLLKKHHQDICAILCPLYGMCREYYTALKSKMKHHFEDGSNDT